MLVSTLALPILKAGDLVQAVFAALLYTAASVRATSDRVISMPRRHHACRTLNICTHDDRVHSHSCAHTTHAHPHNALSTTPRALTHRDACGLADMTGGGKTW